MTDVREVSEWAVLITENERAGLNRLGNERLEESKHRPGKNGAPSDGPKALQMELQGAHGEGGCYKALRKRFPAEEIHWNKLIPRGESVAGKPDFIIRGRHWLDAKGVLSLTHRLLVQRDDEDMFAYIPVYMPPGAEHMALLGWLYGHEAKKYPVEEPQGGRPCHCVPLSANCLHPMGELIKICRL